MRGIAEKSAVLLLGELALLPPGMTVREWVAHAGLDPKKHTSGTSVKACERISKIGNARIRRALYMPAQVAIQHEPHVRAFYEQLVRRGKPKMVAVVAVMLGALARHLRHAVGTTRTSTERSSTGYRQKPCSPLDIEESPPCRLRRHPKR